MIKLKAKTDKDLVVISTLLQDAILPIGDFAYIKAENRIMFALNRYCWEDDETAIKSRNNSILKIENVVNVQTKNIDITDRKQSLYVLDLVKDDGEYLIIHFAEEKQMRVEISDLEISLFDIGEKWIVDQSPKH